MEPHPLKILLQSQLASDSLAVLHLPYVLPTLSPQHLLPSPHLQKWIARLNSLIHSKDPGARWAGLVLATKTSVLSKSIMMEHAQSWIGAALPLLSKSEPAPNLKAAIRLLLHIFSAANDIPEFQRQLATPNVPKFSLALVALAEKPESNDLKLLALETLAELIPLYPTLHKSLYGSLTTLCLRHLSGSAPKPTTVTLLSATSRLYAVLPVTGGKVGAANLWRKGIDETLTFAWAAFVALRTTFPFDARLQPSRQQPPSRDDSLLSVPLSVDRLRSAVRILCDLLRFTTSRPLQVPVGPLAKFCQILLSCTPDEKKEGHVDPTIRTMEEAVIPELWKLGAELLGGLLICTRQHMTPNVARFAAIIVFHLERPLTPAQRIPLLQVLTPALTLPHTLHHPILPTRITKALLSILSVLLPSQPEAQSDVGTSGSKSRKGKKRAREYDGDEVFKISNDMMCPSLADGEMVMAALDALRLVLRNPYVSPASHSVACRVLLSLNLALPLLPPSHVSVDLNMHTRLLSTIQAMCLELGAGTPSAMSKSLGLVMHELRDGLGTSDSPAEASPQRFLDVLLHPRAPPLVRSLPHVETLSLFRAEEATEEVEVREALHIGAIGPPSRPSAEEPQGVNRASTPPPSRPLYRDTAAATAFPTRPASSALSSRLRDDAPSSAPIQSPKTVSSARETASLTTGTISQTPAAVASASSDARPPPRSSPERPEVAHVVMPMEEDEDNEEIPSIDMGSDSE
ncbi:hypothetical protein BV25DRAFT_1613288 [Artomyces pyxidatus]|uniref:Uncharacterized protein n=1 Tax=Artomyces pyxidatus TaxID=48021 RepID=A0ACB8TCS6_9AGAM|nr:hypothetical protein BV25DRAFT_1613288 [Artomyces pyxidatus]